MRGEEKTRLALRTQGGALRRLPWATFPRPFRTKNRLRTRLSDAVSSTKDGTRSGQLSSGVLSIPNVTGGHCASLKSGPRVKLETLHQIVSVISLLKDRAELEEHWEQWAESRGESTTTEVTVVPPVVA